MINKVNTAQDELCFLDVQQYKTSIFEHKGVYFLVFFAKPDRHILKLSRK